MGPGDASDNTQHEVIDATTRTRLGTTQPKVRALHVHPEHFPILRRHAMEFARLVLLKTD